MVKKIEVTELVLRDAHQSLMATRMAFEDMQPVLTDLDEAGYWSLECWGGATFDACIRFLNEDPWERLRQFKKQLPKTPLQMLLRGQNLLGYRHYADDVVDRFVDKAAENGIGVFRIFDALNDTRNLERAIQAVKKSGKHAQGCVSYTVSPVHDVPSYVDLAKRLQDMEVDSICIKDMAALIKPQAAYDLVSGIKQACGAEMKVHMHVHATTGVTLVSLMKAIEGGLDMADTAVSSMSLGTGHNPTEAFCEMLEGTAYTTAVDLKRVARVSKHFAQVKPKYKEFLTSFSGVNTAIFKSQIPGGMLSNMESQLKQQGAADKMDAVLAEVPKVRKDAGYPPLVTPSSQIVGTQAVFNVMMGRYKRMTGEFQDLMLGYYGKCTAEADTEVVKIAVAQSGKKPITTRPADALTAEFDTLRKKAEALTGFNGSDEDVLTYALFPQVAPGFFENRHKGPLNVAKDLDQETPEPVPSSRSATSGPRAYTISVNGKSYQVEVQDGLVSSASSTQHSAVSSPSPSNKQQAGQAVQANLAGTVLRLAKKEGDQVSADETILVLEAMKMETEVSAGRAGTLLSWAIAPGDQVQVGDVLAHIG